MNRERLCIVCEEDVDPSDEYDTVSFMNADEDEFPLTAPLHEYETEERFIHGPCKADVGEVQRS